MDVEVDVDVDGDGGTQGRQSIEKFSIRLKLIRHPDD